MSEEGGNMQEEVQVPKPENEFTEERLEKLRSAVDAM